MSERDPAASAWLIRVSGVESGRRYALNSEQTMIGRSKGSHIKVRGEGADVVSSEHVRIEREDDGGYRIVDHGSTNGLFVNGSEIESARLAEGATIELGRGGPKYRFTLQPAGSPSVFRHVSDSTAAIGETAARLSRAAIKAVRKPNRAMRRAFGFVALVIFAVLAYGYRQATETAELYADLNVQLFETEGLIEAGAPELETLITEADELRHRLGAVEDSFWFSFAGIVREQPFVEQEIERLLEEFGAERYSVPGELVRDVEDHIERLQTADRRIMERAFSVARPRFEAMRAQFEAENLPPDLAYVVLVESNLRNYQKSHAGAVGLWQLRAPTARQYGLRVDDEVDERLDPIKSTEAASKYLKRLILEFGSGSSVMLALAAYNLGPTRVRAAVRRVEDPIQQRNFWYLYRARRLPGETRDYVPKILAAMIIGRNPEKYGFED